MKSRDCGNQRTGQPRCAQLIANTWNWSPPMRRTQHAIFAVAPSQATRNGFSYVASRVWPSGKLATGAELDPRLAGAAAHRRQDVADERDPHQRGRDRVQREPELEEEAASRGCSTRFCGSQARRSVAHRLRPLRSPGRAHPARDRLAARRARPTTSEICCGRRAAARRRTRASRASRGRAARRSRSCGAPDRSPAPGTTVDDRARPSAHRAVRAVAARAGRGVDRLAALRVAERRGVRRHLRRPRVASRTRPGSSEPVDQRVDLLRRSVAARRRARRPAGTCRARPRR